MEINTIQYNPKVWGPHFWFFINTLAMSYPNKPHESTRKKYYEFIQNLAIFIPNPEIGNDFAKYLDKFPVTPYLDSRESFLKWVHFIHNKMNMKLEKPLMSFDEFIENYNKHYLDDGEKKEEEYRWRHKIVYTVLLLTLFLAILWSYQNS